VKRRSIIRGRGDRGAIGDYLVLGVWAFGRPKRNVNARSPEGSAMVTKAAPQSRQVRRVNARNSNDTRVSVDPQLLHATSPSGASQWIIARYKVSNLDAVPLARGSSRNPPMAAAESEQKLHGV